MHVMGELNPIFWELLWHPRPISRDDPKWIFLSTVRDSENGKRLCPVTQAWSKDMHMVLPESLP